MIAAGTAVVAAIGILQGQTGLKVGGRQVGLEPPVAVAVGIRDVNWERTGKALMYDAVDADGYYQGMFRTSDGKAKALLRIPNGTNFHTWKWLPNRLAVIEVISRELPGESAVRWSVYLLDAAAMTARELAGWNYPKDEQVSADLEISPTRNHAILTIRDSKGSHPFVLIEGGNALTPSGDIAQAIAQGSSFRGWSADGTAYYSAGRDEVEPPVEGVLSQGMAIQFLGASKGKASTPILGDIPIVGRFFFARRAAPKAGTPVLEVMPWNGGLRPVRSRGPFDEGEGFPPPVVAEPVPAQVYSAERRGSSGALWMVEAPSEKNPKPSGGVLLIAADGEKPRFDPSFSHVSYETAGALFVRMITVR